MPIYPHTNSSIQDGLDLLSTKWKARQNLSSNEFRHLIDYICQNQFGRHTVFLSDLATSIFQFCPSNQLDELAKKTLKLTDSFQRMLATQCVATDLSSPRLAELLDSIKIDKQPIVESAGENIQRLIDSPLGALKKLLDSCRRRIGATSYTFYVPNSFPGQGYFLFCYSGLYYPECAYGTFLRDDVPFGMQPRLLTAKDRLASTCKLFGNFVSRENIEDYFDDWLDSAGGSRCRLFFNFDEVDRSAKTTYIQHFRDPISALLPAVLDSSKLSAEKQQQLHRIESRLLQPEIPFTTSLLGVAAEECLDALEIPKSESIVWLGFCDTSGAIIDSSAAAGKSSEECVKHRLQIGENLPSWVVLKERSVKIDRFDQSGFGTYGPPLLAESKSAISVPIRVPDAQRGVFHVESSRTQAFSVSDLRFVSALTCTIASQLASRKQLVRSYSEIRRFSKSVGKSAKQVEGITYLDSVTLDSIESLEADYLDIWCKNKKGEWALLLRTGEMNVGKSQRPRRENGRTELVASTDLPFWFLLPKDDGDSEIGFKFEDGRWIEQDVPPSHPGKEGIACELAIPFEALGKGKAVAWIKYVRNRALPHPDDITRLEYLAEQVASAA